MFHIIPTTHAQGNVFNSGQEVRLPVCQDGQCGISEGIKQVGEGLGSTGVIVDKNTNFLTYIQDLLADKVLIYLFLLMVLLIIFAGFLILTAAGNEDQVSKAKKVILYAIIGVIVIFLAGSITLFIFDIFIKK